MLEIDQPAITNLSSLRCSHLANDIQSAAQTKLMENAWAPEESDTTLSEYVTMMLVNGKDSHGVQAELGGELLGVGEDDPQVVEFVGWLFAEAQRLAGGGGQTAAAEQPAQMEGLDENMGDVGEAPVEGAPSGRSLTGWLARGLSCRG